MPKQHVPTNPRYQRRWLERALAAAGITGYHADMARLILRTQGCAAALNYIQAVKGLQGVDGGA